MASQPDDGAIDTLLDFLAFQLTREDAGKLLQVTNWDVQAAVEKYYTTEPSDLPALLRGQSNTGWDNSAFSADRYGGDSGTSVPSFNIEYALGVDNYPHSNGPSAAPTRPNSAASRRSGSHAGDAPRPSIEGNQESGVIDGSGTSRPVFGPARAEYYDNAQWAMVTTTKNVEYIPDASPFHQSRNPNMPAFIKPTPTLDYLPALLTILHSIPLYRNAFLATQISRPNYWLGDEWWKGNADAVARTVDFSSGNGSPSVELLDLLFEVQRLMAFLDITTRSYASLESLFQLDAWREAQLSPEEPSDLTDDAVKFLMRWAWAYQANVPGATISGTLCSRINVGGSMQDSFLLDANVVPRENVTNLHLYDVLDDSLFDTQALNAHIKDISDVLILKLCASKEGSTVDCTIPATLYADRYLEINRGPVDAMFAERKQLEEQLSNISIEVDKVKFHKPRTQTANTKPMETLTMLKTSMKAFGPETRTAEENPQHTVVLAQLETLYQNIERKLSSLEEERGKIQEALNDLTRRFRAPADDPAYKGEYPYALWGVATSSLDYYILHPDASSEEPSIRQWWHVKYTYEGEDASITRIQVTEEEVLYKAHSESGRVLVVYANEAATSVPSLPLSAPLEEFVKKDNLSFVQEMQRREEEWNNQNGNEGVPVQGDWMNVDSQPMEDWIIDDPPEYEGTNPKDYQWDNVSAKKFHQQTQQSGSGRSSTTLTPNTEVDDGVGMSEMQEVNGGIAAWAGGGLSNASSDALGASDPMDVTEERLSKLESAHTSDVEMGDVGARKPAVEPEIQHIETVAKKGG